MSQSFSTEDLSHLFTYPFKDPEWVKKFIIGGLITLAAYIIPVVPFVLIYGYMSKIMRAVIEQGELTLPEWDDWGGLFTDGIKLFGIMFVVMIPIFVVMMTGFGLFFLSAGMAGAAADTTDAAAIFPAVGMMAMFCGFGVAMLLGLLISLIMPVMWAHVVATGEFGAAFRVAEWWAIFRANIGGFLLAYVVFLALSMALGFLFTLLYFTIILICIMPLVMPVVMLYQMIMQGALFGQAYREGARLAQV